MAVLDARGNLMAATTWKPDAVRQSLDVLIRTLHVGGYTTHAVVERVPRTEKASPTGVVLGKVSGDIMQLLEETYEIPLVTILPGEWKPSRVARVTKLPPTWQEKVFTQHEKDAILMGRYVLDKIHRKPRARVKSRVN